MLLSYFMKKFPSPLTQSYSRQSRRRQTGKFSNLNPLAVESLEERTLLAFQALLAPTALSAAPSSAVSFDVHYQTQNDSGTPTVLPSNGMTVRTFFSSAKMTFQSTTNTLQTDLFADTSMEDDTENLDGDATTDKYLNVTWFSSNSTFPTGTQPVRLFTANFTAAANFTGTTKVNFGGLPGANFQFKSSPLTITAAAPQMPAQVLTPSVTSISAAPNTAVSFDVNYLTKNASGVTTAIPSNGLTVSTFYNSSKLTFQEPTNYLMDSIFSQASVQDDTEDLDSNPATDKFFNIVWFSSATAFPNGAQPVKLFTANFTAAANFTGSTTVGFGGHPGANFKLQSTPVTVSAAAPAIPTQLLTPSSTNVQAPAGTAFNFDLNYRTLNANGVATPLPSNGLTVSTFYDSSKMTFQEPTNYLSDSLFSQASVQDDTEDLDNNPLTDKYFNVVWFSVASTFPTGTQPVRLFTANFTAANNFTGSTTIDFGGHPGANFKIDSTPVTVSATLPALTVSMNSNTNAVTNVLPIPVTVQFANSVTGFTASDVIVTGGTVSNFSGSGASYSFNVTPTVQGTVTVNIPANVAIDAGSHGNLAATALTRVFDNQGPLLTSATTVTVLENTINALVVVATDPRGPVAYSISGGVDASRFTINTATGQLSFISAPTVANPTDSNLDSVYVVQVTATDAVGNTSSQSISVTVTDVIDRTATITPLSSNVTYIARTSAISVMPNATFNVSGAGNPDFSNATLFFDGPFSRKKKIFNSIAIRSTGTGAGQIQVQGLNILYGGIVIGTSSGAIRSSGAESISVNLNSSATTSAIQALIRAFTFSQFKPKPIAADLSVHYYPDRTNFSTPGSTHAYVTVNVRK